VEPPTEPQLAWRVRKDRAVKAVHVVDKVVLSVHKLWDRTGHIHQHVVRIRRATRNGGHLVVQRVRDVALEVAVHDDVPGDFAANLVPAVVREQVAGQHGCGAIEISSGNWR